MPDHGRRRMELPDWPRWLSKISGSAARSLDDYELRLAALEWMLSSSLDINSIQDFRSLPSPTVEPFEHQVQNAILFFRRLAPRGLIADDVGLGKTVTAGLIARELMVRGRVESVLIVCPKSLLPQWHEELSSKFSITAKIAVGQDFSELEKHPFWITTYATARSRIEAIRSNKFDLLVLDEAHALRNLHGTAKAPEVALGFESLMRTDAVRFCLMLTATPIQNRLWDMFSLLEILRAPLPNPLGTTTQFKQAFVKDKEARALKHGTGDAFREKVRETTIRTRRADTSLLFPTREVKDQSLLPTPEEKEFLRAGLSAILSFPPLVQATHARTLMSSPWAGANAFRQEADKHPFEPDKRKLFLKLAEQGDSIRTSAKVDAVIKLVSASAKNGRAARIIVFTQRVATIAHIASALEGAGFKGQVGTIRGGDATEAQRSIEDFRAEPSIRPILLSTDAGAVGLNLQAGNIIVNYDLPWNPMVIEQRIGRVQRLGQTASSVIVYNLVLKGTIEDQIVRRIMEKLALFSQAIGEMEELLELCGYDEEHRSLESVIMGLIRKAAEQKDVAEDMRLAEESRVKAEIRLKEMRAATEEALASIRPKDTGNQLTGLARVEPRLELQDLVKGCLNRAGVTWRQDDSARFFVKESAGEIQFVFDRQATPVPAHSRLRLISPGTRAFEKITQQVRSEAAHRVIDMTAVGLDRVLETVRTRLGPLGMVEDGARTLAASPMFALKATVKASAEVASDRYETVLETEHTDPEDEVGSFFAPGISHSERATAFPQIKGAALSHVASALDKLEVDVRSAASRHDSIQKFCDFYDKRYEEDLERLADHIRRADPAYGKTMTAEALVSIRARSDEPIAAAHAALQQRFTPKIVIDPLGIAGLKYDRAQVEVLVRNRRQRSPLPVKLDVVPVSGVLRTSLPTAGSFLPEDEGWACPGGHIVPERSFVLCADEGCPAGACESCSGASIVTTRFLQNCVTCDARFCADHYRRCIECGKPLCNAHGVAAGTQDGVACSACTVVLEDGRKVLRRLVAESAVSGALRLASELGSSGVSGLAALPDELVTCEVSGTKALPDETIVCAATGKRVLKSLTEESAYSSKRALRDRLARSDVSKRLALPDEVRLCDETGAILLPDEVGTCSVTKRSVRVDLLEEDGDSGERMLRRLMKRSDVSKRFVLAEHAVSSDVTGREGLSVELRRCSVCERPVLQDEVRVSPSSGRIACDRHFVASAATGALFLPEDLQPCQATGKLVERSLLRACPETTKMALDEAFTTCEASGARVLPEGIEACSVTGRRVRSSLLVACEESGRRAVAGTLVPCAVTKRLVHPDLLVTCPETGSKILAAAAQPCAESGTRVHPEALHSCHETGRVVRDSLLGTDDVTGSRVLGRLLQRCEETGKQTLESGLGTSAVSGRRVLKEMLVPCEVSGRLALARELARCSETGRAVHPDLLFTCPEGGRTLLREAGVRCEVSGQVVAPEGLGTCEATGAKVRRSLLGVDEVTGKPVQKVLLRPCEATGRLTVTSSLVRSAVSGKQVLMSISSRCAESGAWALPDELEGCSVSGKRVLPSLLERCQESGRACLRGELRVCEASGKKVLPEYLGTCSQTGKKVFRAILGRPEISAVEGLAELLKPCHFSERKAFPAELVASEISGHSIGKDRIERCSLCARTGDVAEMVACSSCGQHVCPKDIRDDVCRSCRTAFGRSTGRSLEGDELKTAQRHRPWASKGWVVESQGLVHVVARSGMLTLPRQTSLLIFRRTKPGTRMAIGEFLDERPVDPELATRLSD